MILLYLFLAFFRVGLCSIGGGLATIPFLTDIGTRTGLFTYWELANMIAVSESTPGPMGVNMATYVGYTTAGVAGAVTATLGLVAPSIMVILLISRFLQSFRQSKVVDAVFYGLRPASTALIASAGLSVTAIALFNMSFSWGVPLSIIHWKALVLAVGVFVCLHVKSLKKLHPVVYILASGLLGVIFKL